MLKTNKDLAWFETQSSIVLLLTYPVSEKVVAGTDKVKSHLSASMTPFCIEDNGCTNRNMTGIINFPKLQP